MTGRAVWTWRRPVMRAGGPLVRTCARTCARAVRRGVMLVALAVVPVVVLVGATAAPGSLPARGAGPQGPADDATAGGTAPREASAVVALAGRCRRAMVQGTCRAMAAAVDGGGTLATAGDAARVFVAGTGEVDASAYEALSRFGDQMCDEAERECRQAWDGTACRIARSLYPSTS